MSGINVLSTFDGMACGRLALERAGIEVENYFASEIDKYAIKIAKKNFPDIIHLGDVERWREWDLPKIDLLIGGSPCQGFSNAGKGLNFDDPRSRLFFVYVDILKSLRERNPDLKFLLENVRMKKEWQDIISKYIGAQPVMIDSALVSAQSRRRLYWANWDIGQPEDRGIVLSDIIEEGEVDREKAYSIDANYYKGGSMKNYVNKKRRQIENNLPEATRQSERRLMVRGAAVRNQVTKRGVEEQLNVRKDEKSNTVVSSFPSKLNGLVSIGRIVGRRVGPDGKRDDYNRELPLAQRLEITRQDGKSGAISTVQKDNVLVQGIRGGHGQPKATVDEFYYRQLTPVECERLQTLPDNYTEGVSNAQRYKMIGNGWTVDAIVHILSSCPNLK